MDTDNHIHSFTLKNTIISSLLSPLLTHTPLLSVHRDPTLMQRVVSVAFGHGHYLFDSLTVQVLG